MATLDIFNNDAFSLSSLFVPLLGQRAHGPVGAGIDIICLYALVAGMAASLGAAGQKAVAPDMLAKFAATARQRMRIEGGGYRREHVRALAQRVEVDVGEVRILGSKSNLLQALIAGATETKPGAVPSFVPKWCTRRDSNPRPPD